MKRRTYEPMTRIIFLVLVLASATTACSERRSVEGIEATKSTIVFSGPPLIGNQHVPNDPRSGSLWPTPSEAFSPTTRVRDSDLLGLPTNKFALGQATQSRNRTSSKE
jgi:hypothetical protein